MFVGFLALTYNGERKEELGRLQTVLHGFLCVCKTEQLLKKNKSNCELNQKH